MKIYVASSWRNPYQPAIVKNLRDRLHLVYDFRHPKPGNEGFSWKQIIEKPPSEWTFEEYRDILDHPIAEEGFLLDMHALETCDALLMVLPCGRSAHLELGYAMGAGKHTALLYPSGMEITRIGDHTCSVEACDACGKFGGIAGNCRLPANLYHQFEPELMVKGAEFLIGRNEFSDWADRL